MAKVTGVGGIMFKTSDPAATGRWFTEHLGIPTESWGAVFHWAERGTGKKGSTVLGLQPIDGTYFTGSKREFMLNLRVDDLDAVLAQLAAKGITPVRTFPDEPNGRFAHVPGPDGMTLELWQPADPDPYDSGP